MSLRFNYLPDIKALKSLQDQSTNHGQLDRHVQEYKKWIFKEMSKVYYSSKQDQETIDAIIESLVTKLAEMSIACRIQDKIIEEIPKWIEHD